jgi:predicted CoA-binding protein
MSVMAALCENDNPRAVLTLLVSRVCDGAVRIIATGSYHAKNDDAAEVSFAVDYAHHGLGLGTLLLERLALEAVRHGFARFWAVTQAENQMMLGVFRDAGYAVKETATGTEIEVDLSLAPGLSNPDRMDLRHRAATVASLRPFFKPRGVAVIGASRSSRNIGRRVLTMLLNGGFKGQIYPVNPKADEIAALKCNATIAEAPVVAGDS